MSYCSEEFIFDSNRTHVHVHVNVFFKQFRWVLLQNVLMYKSFLLFSCYLHLVLNFYVSSYLKTVIPVAIFAMCLKRARVSKMLLQLPRIRWEREAFFHMIAWKASVRLVANIADALQWRGSPHSILKASYSTRQTL